MTRGLVLAAARFAESQLEYAYHRLREDAVLVDVASAGGGPVRGDRGSEWETVAVADLDDRRRYDLVVIPDGEGVDGLAADEPTARFLSAHLDAGGVVCAVAAGVLPLADAGALDGRMVTGFEGGDDELAAAGMAVTGEAVTIDGTVVTVRDTDALPFGVAATLGSVAIPQDPASRAVERPHWEGPDAT